DFHAVSVLSFGHAHHHLVRLYRGRCSIDIASPAGERSISNHLLGLRHFRLMATGSQNRSGGGQAPAGRRCAGGAPVERRRPETEETALRPPPAIRALPRLPPAERPTESASPFR